MNNTIASIVGGIVVGLIVSYGGQYIAAIREARTQEVRQKVEALEKALANEHARVNTLTVFLNRMIEMDPGAKKVVEALNKQAAPPQPTETKPVEKPAEKK